MKVTNALVITFAGLSACASVPSDRERDPLRARAAFDFQCDRAKLKVTVIDSRTRGVEGCGHRAAYVRQCPQFGDCTWILNADSHHAPAASSTSEIPASNEASDFVKQQMLMQPPPPAPPPPPPPPAAF